jgi:hypothetical protein
VARHHREGTGTDQRGFTYVIHYQPDWFQKIRVSRRLENGRHSTATLFQNPEPIPAASPGPHVRTRIVSPDQGVDLEFALNSDAPYLRKVMLSCWVPGPEGGELEEVVFVVEQGGGGRRANGKA